MYNLRNIPKLDINDRDKIATIKDIIFLKNKMRLILDIDGTTKKMDVSLDRFVEFLIKLEVVEDGEKGRNIEC